MKQNTFLNDSNEEDLRTRASNIIALGKSGNQDALEFLIGILENQNEVEWLRSCAAVALGRLSGKAVITPLINALEDESVLVSRAAILALGDTRNKQGIPPLIKILENPRKKELYAFTINVLGQMGGPEVIPTLLRALEDENSQVRCNAALAIGGLRVKEAVPLLIKSLKDSDECLRSLAASALGLIGDKRALAPLIEALDDKAETVRTIAASSLRYLGDSLAVAPLEKTLQDKSEIVRKMAAISLAKLNLKEKAAVAKDLNSDT